MKITIKNKGNLTPKELDTLKWMALGKTNWDISRILGIAEQTTANRVSTILHKLGAVSRAHAVVKAIAKGIISVNTIIFALFINASDFDMRRGARRPSRRRMMLNTSYSIKIVNPYYIPEKKS